MKACYFTATGNCLYVARRIGGDLLSIPQLMKHGEIVIEDDAVGIIAPVYAVEMPMMVKAFLERAQIKTDSSSACTTARRTQSTCQWRPARGGSGTNTLCWQIS